jgi:hypothetical protein
MTTKRPRKPQEQAPPPLPAPSYAPSRAMAVSLAHTDTPAQRARSAAKQIAAPEAAAYRVMSAAEGKGPTGALLDASGMLAELRAAQKAVNEGDLSTAEAMLMAQAVGLQALYVRLIERAMEQEWIGQFETLMRLGLKAQAQSRMALEAVATLKHGPAIMARNAQVNVAHGPQQVNNLLLEPGRDPEASDTPKSWSTRTSEKQD